MRDLISENDHSETMDLLRSLEDGTSEITTLSWWSSMRAIVAFAAEPPERARHYPEDDRYQTLAHQLKIKSSYSASINGSQVLQKCAVAKFVKGAGLAGPDTRFCTVVAALVKAVQVGTPAEMGVLGLRETMKFPQ